MFVVALLSPALGAMADIRALKRRFLIGTTLICVTSTACLRDTMAYFRFIAPIGKFLRVMPRVAVFSRQELKNSLVGAGFSIDYEFVPEHSKAVCFLIAVKHSPITARDSTTMDPSVTVGCSSRSSSICR